MQSASSTLDIWWDFLAFIKYQIMTFRKAKALNPLLISSQDTIAYMSKTKIAANVCVYTHINTLMPEARKSLRRTLAPVLFSILLLIYNLLSSKAHNMYNNASNLPVHTTWFWAVCWHVMSILDFDFFMCKCSHTPF